MIFFSPSRTEPFPDAPHGPGISSQAATSPSLDPIAGLMVEPVMVTASPAFSVVFFDGEHEVELGTIAVSPSMGFKKFQALICQRIGVSPHQISTSLVRRKKARSSPEVRRKVPIDESSDFAAISRERDCFILAVLRRSRRERRSRSRRNHDSEVISAPPLERTILKRNFDPPIHPPASASAAAAGLGLGLGRWGYESQIMNLQKQRERYLVSTAAYHPYTMGIEARSVAAAAATTAVCEECEAAAAEGLAPPAFHWCVRDAVTVAFRSPAGPIQRPSKASA
ncbi:hypothetical protein J5N97_020707 [Dioscorea zingiberensis]|uniref:DUF7138 domain-containing protein n=1 Tax=Dioscorea zingiberensis TaxID=325984 RepID=A0A9D5CGD1_9LILI|nr:hypothetical protein J5N97_020707 [Dioscorea zingiberensis]